MNSWTLYWFTRFEELHNWAGILTSILGIAVVVHLLACTIWLGIAADSYDDNEKKAAKSASKWAKLLIPLFTITSLMMILVPTNKQLAIIIAGSYVTQNEEMIKVPTKATKVLNKFMDEYLDEAEKEAVSSGKKGD